MHKTRRYTPYDSPLRSSGPARPMFGRDDLKPSPRAHRRVAQQPRQRCVVISYPTAQIRATLVRFYMLTNMTLSAATPASRRHETAAPTVLIHGSAIKTSANSPEFNNMQFSNRRQTGGLNNHVDQPSREDHAVADHFPLITRHRSSPIARHSSHLAFPRAECYFVCASRTRQSSPRAPK